MTVEPLLEVRDVSFAYPGRRRVSIHRGGLGLHRLPEKPVLHEVSLQVARGETLAIIGTNGCGKSTLIRLLAGALIPQMGERTLRGSLAAIVELGAGFDSELSVHDNVLLYGALNGHPVAEVRRRIPEILAWADLTDVEWEPVRTLSSGMTARLGFSAATEFLPEVLLVDEVLAVGDGRFKEKSEARMARLVDSGAAVVLVTHDMEAVRDMASRCLWLKDGRIEASGDPLDVVERYVRSL
jgi:ABC-type polysaccharide/polyol phosphate transport system ATPase subunit